jgi:uncharacterized protein
MRVKEDRGPIQDVVPGHGMTLKKGTVREAVPFDGFLKEKTDADAKDTLNKLLDRITEQGELITRRRDINDVKKYRELVSGFLDEAMRSMYQNNKEGAFDARGRYKEYSVVKKINDGLESLTRQVLSDQQDNLAILEQLGTIRGLLVDLMI